MTQNSEKTYWPHMILGFLAIGIMLGYWTISSAVSMPVQKSNEFGMAYQQVDMNINEIKEAQERFDKLYNLEILEFKKSDFKANKYSKRAHKEVYALSKENTISYKLDTKDGTPVADANATLLLTRPHTTADDEILQLVSDTVGVYKTPPFTLTNPGRYTLRLRVQKGDDIGYLSYEAYLKP